MSFDLPLLALDDLFEVLPRMGAYRGVVLTILRDAETDRF